MSEVKGSEATRYEIASAESLQSILKIVWQDGHESCFHPLWLRANCQDENSVAPGTTQRTFDVSELRLDVAVVSVHHTQDELGVVWSDGSANRFTTAWLRDHCPATGRNENQHGQPCLWDASLEPPVVSFNSLQSARGRFDWMTTLIDFGFVILRDVPTTTEEFVLVAERLGYIRETNYGRVFDVVSIPTPNNLAYSDSGLAVHTDNPYRDPVPGIQLLHCLKSHPTGGETVLVDGLRVAAELKSADAMAFNRLAETQVLFRFADDRSDLRERSRLIEIDQFGEPMKIRYNNRSVSIPLIPVEETEAFYAAYRRFAQLLYDPRFEFRYQLAEGDLVAFDNERVLHGRTGFDSSQGERRLRGVYLDRDEVKSRVRILARQLGIRGGDAALPGGPRF